MPFYYTKPNTSLYEKIACYFNYLTPLFIICSECKNEQIKIPVNKK